jgi:DNA invertase Pin-like site-specific DNA recombinase
MYCENNNLNIVEEVHEIKSARNMRYLYNLQDILSRYSNTNLIIYNITRFSRNLLQGVELMNIAKNNNINIHFCEENAKTDHYLDMHRIRLGLSQSEYESDTLSNRVKTNNIILKNKGWSFGVPSYGFKAVMINDIRSFQINEEEQNIIKFIKSARYGKCTVMALNKLLNNILPSNNQPIEFYDEELGETITRFSETYTLTFGEIADLLNSYNISNRGSLWNSGSVNRLYNKNNNIQQNFQSMNI